MQTSYTEQASITTYIVSHPEGFDTVEEALENFAKMFGEYYKENFVSGPKKCCKKAANNYCSVCGRSTLHVDDTGYEHDQFQDFLISNFWNMDLDGTADLSYYKFEETGWETNFPHDEPLEGFVWIENAEDILASLIYGDPNADEDEDPNAWHTLRHRIQYSSSAPKGIKVLKNEVVLKTS